MYIYIFISMSRLGHCSVMGTLRNSVDILICNQEQPEGLCLNGVNTSSRSLLSVKIICHWTTDTYGEYFMMQTQ